MFKHFANLTRSLFLRGRLPTIIPSRRPEECLQSAKSAKPGEETMTQIEIQKARAAQLQDDKPMMLSRRFAPLFWTQFLSRKFTPQTAWWSPTNCDG